MVNKLKRDKISANVFFLLLMPSLLKKSLASCQDAERCLRQPEARSPIVFVKLRC